MTQPSQSSLNHRLAQGILRDQRGLSTVEYVVILVLIAVAAIGTWRTFGGAIVGKIGESTIAIRDMEGNGSAADQKTGQPASTPGSKTPAGATPKTSDTPDTKQAKGKVKD